MPSGGGCMNAAPRYRLHFVSPHFTMRCLSYNQAATGTARVPEDRIIAIASCSISFHDAGNCSDAFTLARDIIVRIVLVLVNCLDRFDWLGLY
jgi:hypothetical protein